MRKLATRISPAAHIAASTVLVAFAILGITNATHVAARIVYGVLIVIGGVLVATGIRRRRHDPNRD